MKASLSTKKVFFTLLSLIAVFLLFTVTAYAEDYGSFNYTPVEPGDGESFEPYNQINGFRVSDDMADTVIQIPSEIEKVPVTKIVASAFAHKSVITEVIIPDTITTIENGAFYGCPDLKVVVIPDSVTYIGESAFQDCDSLEYVLIGNGVKEIGDLAFKDCVSLKYLTLGDSLEKVGNGAFYNCVSLNEIVTPSSLSEIGSYAFGMTEGENGVVPAPGFAIYTDLLLNDSLSAYISQYTVGDMDPVFHAESGFKACEGSHTLEFVNIRPATDAYDGLDAAKCSVCHRIVTQVNTEKAPVEATSSGIASLVIAIVLVVVFVVLLVIYVKKSKKRRAEAIEAYKAGKPLPDMAEKEKADAKAAEKYAKKRAKQEAKLKSYMQ